MPPKATALYPPAAQHSASLPAVHRIFSSLSHGPGNPGVLSSVSIQFKIWDLTTACTLVIEMQSHPLGNQGASMLGYLGPPLPTDPTCSSGFRIGFMHSPLLCRRRMGSCTASLVQGLMQTEGTQTLLCLCREFSFSNGPCLIQLPGSFPHLCCPWPVALLGFLVTVLNVI